MEEGSVVSLPRPGASVADDPLLAVLREGARRMLTQAIEAEIEAFLAAHADLTDEQGRRRLVRNGHAPERQLQTGIGPLEVRRPKVRDRGVAGEGPIRFTSAILPAYLRRGYAQVWCTGSGGGLVLGNLNGLAIAEAYALDHLGKALRAIQPAPVSLGRLSELENHRQRGLA